MDRSQYNTWRITQGKEPLKPMEDIVKHIRDYVNTYDTQTGFEEYSNEIYIDDMLYVIGTSLGPDYKFRNGFVRFKALLLEKLLEDADLQAHLNSGDE